MKRYRVELSPEALEQAQAIRAWWLQNRPSAPDLFVEELGAAIRKLSSLPRIGARYEAPGFREMRRVLLARTRYHAYYAVDEDARLVRIHAIWHLSRRGEPL
jgi:plasmid stabilization system protein ParE